ncbi:MAG TPA: hypothetical protein VGL91_26080 [Acidobacteriota bacterium]|jgi:hypothetical protein
MKNERLSVLLAAFVCGLLSCVAVGQGYRPTQKTFTKAEVSEIMSLLKGRDPNHYRIILPKFENGRIVGSETYGRLPVTQVRRLASLSNVPYSENGNLQAIFQSCNGGGAGSHVESQTPGTDIGRRIDRIVRNIGRSEFVLIY